MKHLILTTFFILLVFAAKSQNKDNADTSRNKVETMADRRPEYPGGMAALGSYIASNTHYPADVAKNIQGKVMITFTIGTDGKVGDVKVAHSVSPELDAEAVRVISGMAQWKPGIQNGRLVRVVYSVPINFSAPAQTKP